MKSNLVSACVLGAFLAPTAFGAAHVAKATVGVGGWSFNTIISDDPAIMCPLVFVAFAPLNEAVGENVIAVRYDPDASSPSGWSSKAWESDSPASIIKQLKIEFSLPDTEDDRWAIATELIEAATPAAPAQEFDKGLFVNDPLYPVASVVQSDQLIQALKDTGYAAAIVPFDKYDATTDCLVPYVLAGVASAAREYEVSGSTAFAAAAFAGNRDNIIDRIGQCIEWCLDFVTPPDDEDYEACDLVVRGAPVLVGAPNCGGVGTAVVTTPGTPAGPGGVPAATPASTQTCFSQTCFTPATRTVTYTNSCTGASTTYTENVTQVTRFECCVSGTATLGPGGVPPCTLALRSTTVQ
jgi:hypothetical protein